MSSVCTILFQARTITKRHPVARNKLLNIYNIITSVNFKLSLSSTDPGLQF